jgi:hypothetical protein
MQIRQLFSDWGIVLAAAGVPIRQVLSLVYYMFIRRKTAYVKL